MKKLFLLIQFILFFCVSAIAQYSPCYQAAFSEGKKLFNQGKYAIAKIYFKESKDCPDPNTKEANSWIAKCDKELALAGETATSCCCITASKMNVVYRGVDNPITIGADGDYSVNVSSGTLKKTGNGTYVLRPGDSNELTVSVNSDGLTIGSMKFRVKDLPMPEAIIRNVVNGLVSKSALLAANRVEAEMKDFDFDGVHYDVVGYTFRYKTKAGTTREAKANSGAFTDEIKNAISGSNVGDTFLFTAIQVRGNDGKTKTLDTPIGVEIW